MQQALDMSTSSEPATIIQDDATIIRAHLLDDPGRAYSEIIKSASREVIIALSEALPSFGVSRSIITFLNTHRGSTDYARAMEILRDHGFAVYFADGQNVSVIKFLDDGDVFENNADENEM